MLWLLLGVGLALAQTEGESLEVDGIEVVEIVEVTEDPCIVVVEKSLDATEAKLEKTVEEIDALVALLNAAADARERGLEVVPLDIEIGEIDSGLYVAAGDSDAE